MAGQRPEYLNLSHVSFAYRNERLILSDFNLEVATGEFVLANGPAGAGKTTLARLITGLIRPTSGELRVEGEPLIYSGNGKCADILARWGIVSDDSTLLPDRTVRENIRTSVRIPSRGVRVSRDITDEALSRFGLTAARSRRPRSLSSSERIMLQLAMAWARSPLLFVLDDIDSGLDPGSLSLATEAIRERNIGGSAVLLMTSSPHMYSSLTCRSITLPTVR